MNFEEWRRRRLYKAAEVAAGETKKTKMNIFQAIKAETRAEIHQTMGVFIISI